MARLKFTLYKYIKLKDGSWRYCEAAFHSNAKIKPNRRIVDQKEEAHPEGAYYLYQRKNWISRASFVRDELLQFPPPFSHRCSASLEACTAMRFRGPQALNDRQEVPGLVFAPQRSAFEKSPGRFCLR
jgi:hypothetical protein